ncbi:MAG TPA: hypothetical protein VFS87_03495 [Qipengyuania sp.]|nr:hypothetical protein [Qipengyuania sp.]
MAQTNVMVTYAPARRPAAPVAEQDRVRDARSRRRWGTALTGVLLAGGAVFALGTFVRPDGSLRDTGFPSPPRVPLATADRVTAPETVPPMSEATAPEPQSSPLPYLAVVRDVAPAPVPPIAAPGALARPAARDAARAPRRVAMRAIAAPVPAADSPSTGDASLVPHSAPEPVTGQRRDLEGFLGEQGLVLAVPPPVASEAIAPVTEWSADDLAPAIADAPPAASKPVSEFAAAGTAPPAPLEPGMAAAVVEPNEDSSAPAELVDVSEPASAQPVAAAETQRLAELVPAADEPELATPADPETSAYREETATPISRLVLPPAPLPAAAGTMTAPADAMAIANRDELKEAAPGLVVAPTAAPVPPGAAIADGQATAFAQSFPLAVVNGEPLGAVTLRDLGPQGEAVHLGALVGLLKLRMPEAEFAWLSSAAAADQFVTLDRLRAAGITVQFDARDGRLLIDAR